MWYKKWVFKIVSITENPLFHENLLKYHKQAKKYRGGINLLVGKNVQGFRRLKTKWKSTTKELCH